LTGRVTQTYAFASEISCGSETSMAYQRTTFRNVVTRGLALIAMLCIYGFGLLGASALLLGASSTSALARGGGHGGGGHGFGGGFHGGGFRGGGFRGAGIGLGLGLGLGYGYYGYPYDYGSYYPYEDDVGACYLVRQRVMTRHGWRIRRVSVCE
jgi:hypothetical protein